MRNLALSLIGVVIVLGVIGYGASQLVQELADIKLQTSELKQAQVTFRSEVAELSKTCDELNGRLDALVKPGEKEGSSEKQIRSLKDQVSKIKEGLIMLRSMSTATPGKRQASMTQEQIDARRQRCQFVEEYLVKLEQIYAIRDPDQRTESRILLDKEFRNTRDFILQVIGARWMESYEDALQAVYYIEDPVRSVAGKAKIKPIMSKIRQVCLDAGLQ